MPTGSIVTGTVIQIAAFGAFIELDNGIQGFIHVSELSDQVFETVEDIIAVGDRVKAKIINIDPELKRISLSIKDFLVERNQYNHDDIPVGRNKENN